MQKNVPNVEEGATYIYFLVYKTHNDFSLKDPGEFFWKKRCCMHQKLYIYSL